jgi:hypothetical protein
MSRVTATQTLTADEARYYMPIIASGAARNRAAAVAAVAVVAARLPRGAAWVAEYVDAAGVRETVGGGKNEDKAK